MNTLTVAARVETMGENSVISRTSRRMLRIPMARMHLQILVDGVCPPGAESDDTGCLLGLTNAAEDGVFKLLNCSCGQFACGGYYHGFRIEHQADGTVTWLNLDRPESPALAFQSTQAVQAVESAIAEIRVRLVELRGQRIEFVCWDDAEVFGLRYDDRFAPGLAVPRDFGASEARQNA